MRVNSSAVLNGLTSPHPAEKVLAKKSAIVLVT